MRTLQWNTSSLRFGGGCAPRMGGSWLALVLPLMLLLVFMLNEITQAQNLVWAKSTGGSGGDEAFGLAIDGAGNTYVTGWFFGSMILGPGEANETTLASAVDYYDVFIAKYNAPGALVWAKRAGGSDFDESKSIAVDGLGNSYFTGVFYGSATFGSGEANETILVNVGIAGDIFVAKYDGSGALVWAKRAGGSEGDGGASIAVDDEGNSYVTGDFGYFIGSGSSATFGSGEANETTLYSAGRNDIFAAKYDASGALSWAKRVGGSSFIDEGRGIAVDATGNSYVTGYFFGSATFGLGEVNEITLNSAGSVDFFVSKYSPSGVLQWVKRAGGPSTDRGFNIAVDDLGNSYVTGNFFGSATFGSGEANETTLIDPNTSGDIFVAKHDASGALVWAKSAGGQSGTDHGLGIAIDGAGNSYVTGSFHSLTTFGLGEVNETTLSGNFNEIFVAKYDQGGGLVWAKRAGGFDYDYGLGIAVDGLGNSYATGSFHGSATFGPGEANEITLSGPSNGDILISKFFIAKYSAPISDRVDNVSDMIDDVLAGGGLSDDAERDLNSALENLQDVQEVLGLGDIEEAFDQLREAAEDLEDAADEGAEVTDILDLLTRIARDVASDTRAEAAGCPVNDPRGRLGSYLAAGDADFARAEARYAAGNYSQAIVYYKRAWEDYDEAVERCEDLLSKPSESAAVTDNVVTDYVLEPNHPNPFNPSTTINFVLPEATKVTLKIYSETGQLVTTLIEDEMSKGRHAILWNGRHHSCGAASGSYFYRLIAQRPNGEVAFTATRRMTLVK